MALDFTIKNNHGVVMHKIPIGLDDFYDIQQIAKTFNPPLSLIGRLEDYYKDEEFFTLELPALKEQLLKVYKKSDEKIKIIPRLILLCDLAILDNTTVCVDPD